MLEKQPKMIAARETWGLGQKRFKNNFQTRMIFFNSLVKSIILYATEIWSWKEEVKVEEIQEKFNTPAPITGRKEKLR